MLRRVVLIVIDSQHKRDVFILCRSRNDDLLHRPAQVLLGIFGVSEASSRFNHHLHADAFPRQRSRVLLFENFDCLTIHRDAVRPGSNFVRQVAEDRVVLQQMGQSFRIGQVIDRHEFQV